MPEATDQEQAIEPPEGAIGDAETETVQTDPETQPEYLDVDEFGNRHVRVVVDGEEQSVPLLEAVQGYQRTADYTRKTQALAQQRESLSQAENLWNTLMSDPEGTIQQLQQALVAEPQPELPDDPVERELAELKAWRQQQEASAAETRVRSDLQSLHEQFGEFDDTEVLQRALQLGTSSLRSALLDVRYEWEQAQKAAEAALQAQNEAAEQARGQAKRDASFVHGGTAVNTGSATTPASGHPTVLDAAKAAASQLGITLNL